MEVLILQLEVGVSLKLYKCYLGYDKCRYLEAR